MDYQMPNMDGPTAAKAIRELGYHGFIIGVTGNVLPDDTTHFINCGANKVLYKPVDVNDLDNTINGMVFYYIKDKTKRL